jgi:hypothetical protein
VAAKSKCEDKDIIHLSDLVCEVGDRKHWSKQPDFVLHGDWRKNHEKMKETPPDKKPNL